MPLWEYRNYNHTGRHVRVRPVLRLRKILVLLLLGAEKCGHVPNAADPGLWSEYLQGVRLRERRADRIGAARR